MHKYQTLSAWQQAHALILLTLRSTDRDNHPRVRALFDQLRRAAISIEANLVEGYALATPALFRRHVRIAIGSAAETECLVRLAGELEYLPADEVNQISVLLDETIACLVGLMRKGLALRS